MIWFLFNLYFKGGQLNMELVVDEKFKKYEEAVPWYANENYKHYHYYFPNGYAASIIPEWNCVLDVYPKDRWELALKINFDDDWHLCYKPIVNDDVLRYLTSEQVNDVLELIMNGEVGKEVDFAYEQ